MKNNNIEEQLKHTLGNRSIAPSADAWERLAHNRQQSKKGKKKFGFFFIAASLAFLLAGGGLFTILRTDAVITSPSVVNTTIKQEATPAETIVPIRESAVAINDEPVTKHKTVTPAYDDSMTSAPRTQAYALAIDNTAGLNSHSTTATAQPIINPKAANANDMYDAQAAMLLQQAANDIALQRQKVKTTNDTALLKEVESEMTDYYRDKAMRFFVLKHKTIRFAVRDQQ